MTLDARTIPDSRLALAGKKKRAPYGFGLTTKCQHCKKPFERPVGQWGWNIGDKLYCTYKCMRAAETKMKAKRLKGEKKHAQQTD